MPRLALLRNALFGSGAPAPPAPGIPFIKQMIELELAGVGQGWTDVSCDVRDGSMVVCEYGIQGSEPGDCVASTGSLSFELDNGGRNSIGWHSPLHPDRRPGFNLNIGVRYSIGPEVGPRTYKFQGKLAVAIPTTGIHGVLVTSCIARDFWDDYARMPMPDLPVQSDQRSDQLIHTILNALPLQPAFTSIELGQESFVRALDGGTGQQLTVREAINQVCLSESGRAYRRGSSSTGSYFYFENRQHRTANPPIEATLTDSDPNTPLMVLEAPGSRDDIYATVRVIVHPVTEDPIANREVASLQTATLRINSGETITSLFLPYRDSGNDNMIGAVDQIVPVIDASHQDYAFNTQADGAGTDIATDLAFSVVFNGDGVRFPTLTNNGAFTGYLTRLVVRGRGLIRGDTILEQTIPGAYGDKVYTYDMPYQSSVNAGQGILDRIASIFASPFANVPAVTFCATSTSTLFNYALYIEPGSRIVLSEQVSGIESQPFTVNRVRTECGTDGFMWVTWGLEQASGQLFWLIGVPDFSEAGQTTIAGF